MEQPTLYEFLEVPVDATTSQINKAFREKALIYHPDRNKTDPDAVQKFQLLLRAQQILTDPIKRDEYDASIAETSSDETGLPDISDLQTLWEEVGHKFFEQSERFSPAIDAVRMSKPILLDTDLDLLVVGISSEQGSLIGYLNSMITHNQVRNILRELSGRQIDFRLISGTTTEDWQQIKESSYKREMLRHKLEEAALAGIESDSSLPSVNGKFPFDVGRIWEDALEAIARQWTNAEYRNQPQGRARYILAALPFVSRAEDMSRAAGSEEEIIQKNIGRLLERIASSSTVDSSVIGLEYMRYRTRQMGGN